MTEKTASNRFIDLNCDMGEGFGAYSFGQDEPLLKYISSANIACGFHAGDPHIMRETVRRCIASGVAVGAHPGLPDRLGFGRRDMAISPQEAYDYVLYQTGALAAFVQAAGGRLNHVKPHGALYHLAGRDPNVAEAVVKAVKAIDPALVLFGQAGSRLLEEADRAGLPSASEVFADRTYLASGELTPRQRPGAIIHDAEAAVRQALSIVTHGIAECGDGSLLNLRADTICLHGDVPGAALFADRLRSGLEAAGLTIRPPFS
ncbi:LamB/YcsF family protein [Paenibacillus tarimensis]